ncbi:MAG: hypothetical protein HY423_16280 [Candidatus Lambdaproteobacteria bacterium]|nr:hypothetical protein [Candidatus Lambdaproteobacteria bacterium]
MSLHEESAAAWHPYEVRTHNHSTASENRMHSDEVARTYGFQGGLVPGVGIFAHMTRPLVARYGTEWLSRGVADVTLHKPAYEGDLLTVRTVPTPGSRARRAHTVTCSNAQGVTLATMTTEAPEPNPSCDPRGELPSAPPVAERQLATWELMEIGKPFPAHVWRPTLAENLEWCENVGDDLPLYREGDAPCLHPGFILRQANRTFRTLFVLPAWIHAGSRITFHEPARVGPTYEVRAIPEEKWQKKGHEFVRLYVAVRAGGRTLAEIRHNAIFRPRKAG